MNFELDVFVSYAHLDDAALIEGKKGWVENLHRALEIRVGMFHGKSPHIWRDPKLQGNDVLSEKLKELIRQAAVLVSVVTPRYVRSESTAMELIEFCKACAQQGGLQIQNKARIFKVLKMPVPLDEQSAELQTLLGYEFFTVDPESGKVREFDDVFGPDAQRSFWIKLDDLAHDICDLLDIVEGPERGSAPEEGHEQGVVFLAETTGDLREQREAIRRDLQQHGYTVLPALALSPIKAEVEATVRDDLARCSMSIHLIGKRYSLTPEGADTSLIEIQNELAIERGERGSFSRLVWIPKDLQVEDPRQRRVIDQLRMDPRMGTGADLLESPLEVLLTVIQQTLERERAKKAAPPPAAGPSDQPAAALASVYLLYDERDAAAVTPFADFLFEQNLEVVHPVFEGSEAEVREYHQENLRTADGIAIFVGEANAVWLNRKLTELQKIAGYGRTKKEPVVAVCLLPPKTADKERFRTHKAIVLPQWSGLERDPWQSILARLKG
jgi:hypothetical protein